MRIPKSSGNAALPLLPFSRLLHLAVAAGTQNGPCIRGAIGPHAPHVSPSDVTYQSTPFLNCWAQAKPPCFTHVAQSRAAVSIGDLPELGTFRCPSSRRHASEFRGTSGIYFEI